MDDPMVERQSEVRSPKSVQGQATLEMAVAFAGALLLLAASLKLCFWFSERYVRRQRSYEATRVQAGDQEPGRGWTEPRQRLELVK